MPNGDRADGAARALQNNASAWSYRPLASTGMVTGNTWGNPSACVDQLACSCDEFTAARSLRGGEPGGEERGRRHCLSLHLCCYFAKDLCLCLWCCSADRAQCLGSTQPKVIPMGDSADACLDTCLGTCRWLAATWRWLAGKAVAISGTAVKRQ